MPFGLGDPPITALFGLFLATALLVWNAGSRPTRNVIAEKRKLGKAFMGMFLLGGITSMPRVAAVSPSPGIANAPLRINNLIGTASINRILLAIAVAIHGRDPRSPASGTSMGRQDAL